MDARYANDKPILVETTAYRDFKTGVGLVLDLAVLACWVMFMADLFAVLLWNMNYFFYVKPADRDAYKANRGPAIAALRLQVYFGFAYFAIIAVIAFFVLLVPLALIFMPCSYVPPTAP